METAMIIRMVKGVEITLTPNIPLEIPDTSATSHEIEINNVMFFFFIQMMYLNGKYMATKRSKVTTKSPFSEALIKLWPTEEELNTKDRSWSGWLKRIINNGWLTAHTRKSATDKLTRNKLVSSISRTDLNSREDTITKKLAQLPINIGRQLRAVKKAASQPAMLANWVLFQWHDLSFIHSKRNSFTYDNLSSKLWQDISLS